LEKEILFHEPRLGLSIFARAHNFDDGVKGFFERFKRYGEGNKKISELYKLDMKPKPFKPIKKTLVNYFLACFQYYCLYKGYTAK
jgi:hypothetical protein